MSSKSEVAPAAELQTESRIVRYLAAVRVLGGQWHAIDPVVRWIQLTFGPLSDADNYALAFDDPAGDRFDRHVSHVVGRLILELEGRVVEVEGVLEQNNRGMVFGTIFRGTDRTELVLLERRLRAALPTARIQVWGGPVNEVDPTPLLETDVVLPEETASALYPWLDRFWRLAPQARSLAIAPRRGVLLVGPQGTGKTQLVRHLITRYPEANVHLFLPHRRFDDKDPFGGMMEELRRPGPGAIVVLEDLDRMIESGAVTREYLLNCLDGLLQLGQPVLWVATANDPELFDPAILQRPGRFDRIVRFALPDLEGRVKLLGRNLRGRVEESLLRELAVAADGLSGAALRSWTEAALLASLDTGEPIAVALERELETTK